jgi:hypothetical protein
MQSIFGFELEMMLALEGTIKNMLISIGLET